MKKEKEWLDEMGKVRNSATKLYKKIVNGDDLEEAIKVFENRKNIYEDAIEKCKELPEHMEENCVKDIDEAMENGRRRLIEVLNEVEFKGELPEEKNKHDKIKSNGVTNVETKRNRSENQRRSFLEDYLR